MKAFSQPGHTISVLAPYDVIGGAGVQVGNIFGVAEVTALNGAPVEIVTEGVFDLKKVGSQGWTVGQKIYWDNTSNHQCTSVAGTNRFIGFAMAIAGSGAGVVVGRVLLVAGGDIASGVLGVAASYKIAGGVHETAAAADTVVTGLATVVSVMASFDSDPVDGAMFVTASRGNQAGVPAAGSFILSSWKNTDADSTHIAADTFLLNVGWIAIGT